MINCTSDLKGKDCELCSRYQDDCDGAEGWGFCEECEERYCYEDEGTDVLCQSCADDPILLAYRAFRNKNLDSYKASIERNAFFVGFEAGLKEKTK